MQRLWPNPFRRPTPVRVQRFDSGRWVGAAGARDAGRRDRLNVATYNIWFNALHAQQRYRAIADVLASEPPDVMVFQEVTPRALNVFRAQPWIRENYRSAAVTGGRLGNYGMLLLSRLPIARVTYTRLPTRLSRGYLTARFEFGGVAFTVVGLHLESGKAAAELRQRQLGQIVGSVHGHDDVALLGDFNLRDAENGIIPTPFVDVWPTLRPDDPGYTEDTTINHMRYDMKDKHRHVRFDRVLLKGERWAAQDITLLGREPIADDLPRVFPSDHFGVRCTLTRRG
ncbi:endonuclease/exonuclease/phosphatase family protein [Mycobacterium sp. NPDC003323]